MSQDNRFEMYEPVIEKDAFGDLIAFAKAYIRNFYTLGRGELSARDFRYAARAVGYDLEHSDALIIIDNLEKEVFEDLAQQRHEEDIQYGQEMGESTEDDLMYLQ